jgi:acetyltransferase-like isoleucine patch superfamily enzyme
MKFLQYIIDRLRIFIGGLIRDSKELPNRNPKYKIGRGSYGPLEIEVFGDDATLEIGAFCSFAKGVKILLGGEHRKEWITTYPFDRKYFFDASLPHSTFAKGNIIIGNDVWVGTDVLILSGANIGNGVIIAAKSLVKGHLEPYGIYAGSPAKLVGKRFEDNVISELEKIAWWNWADEKIKKNSNILLSDNIEKFLNIKND